MAAKPERPRRDSSYALRELTRISKDEMETVFPTIAVFLFMAAATFLYRDRIRAAFGRSAISPEVKLDSKQLGRFAPYEHAALLQLATNNWHNKAIQAKSKYECVGVAICCAAPALVILRAAFPGLDKAGWASEYGVTIADGIVCSLVLLVVFCFRKPNKPHVEYRLRAELLRSHLHCLLAKVGPYSADESAAEQVNENVCTLDVEEIKAKLIGLERQCTRQADGHEVLPSPPAFPIECADAYLMERVGEQMGDPIKSGYFTRAANRMQRSYKQSAQGFLAALILATVIGILRVVAPDYVAPKLADFLYASCVAFAALIIGLRSVFGWDSKSGLYVRQTLALQNLTKELRSDQEGIAKSTAGAAQVFRRHAAAFEALMARETCDWQLISDRESYDVTP